jgi:hypothetical protein
MTKSPPDGTTAKALAGATTPRQAIPSPHGIECNLRGEVTEKFCTGANCDFMTVLIYSVRPEPALSSAFDLCPLEFRHLVIFLSLLAVLNCPPRNSSFLEQGCANEWP